MRFKVTIAFDLDGIDDLPDHREERREELRDYIADALEGWGGQRRPNDWLFGSLEHVDVGSITKVKS